MTATTESARPQTRGGGILAAAKLAFATVGTRGRLIASVVGVLFFVVLALILQTSTDLAKDEALQIALGAYIFLVLPLSAVSAASQAFGTAVQDNTLVYVWLRPIARWKLALAYVGATVASLLPMIAAFCVSTLVFGASLQFIGALLLASLLMALAYSGMVVALGVRFKRASMMAMTYVVLVETILGSVPGISRISVRNYGVSVFGNLAGDSTFDLAEAVAFSAIASVIVLLAVFAVGVGLTTLFLKKADVA